MRPPHLILFRIPVAHLVKPQPLPFRQIDFFELVISLQAGNGQALAAKLVEHLPGSVERPPERAGDDKTDPRACQGLRGQSRVQPAAFGEFRLIATTLVESLVVERAAPVPHQPYSRWSRWGALEYLMRRTQNRPPRHGSTAARTWQRTCPCWPATLHACRVPQSSHPPNRATDRQPLRPPGCA